MKYIDPHIHMVSRTTDDYTRMALAGCACITEPAFWNGFDRGSVEGFRDYFLQLTQYEPKRAAEARDNFRKAGLDHVIDLRVADAFEEIPKIEGDFDFVFLDAWKPDYLAFWDLVRERVSPGGSFTAHNVIGQENHMRDFLDAVRDDPAFETTIHRLSRAGVSISVRRK